MAFFKIIQQSLQQHFAKKANAKFKTAPTSLASSTFTCSQRRMAKAPQYSKKIDKEFAQQYNFV
eukprot:5381796-Pleurochrysis_carterae.AAC.1